MILADSNVVIYSTNPAYPQAAAFVTDQVPAVSGISYVEALGYHGLSDDDRDALTEFFADAPMLPVTPRIMDRAVDLRQQRKIELGDALIAATALVHGLTLATRNVKHFDWIPGLTVVNPIDG